MRAFRQRGAAVGGSPLGLQSSDFDLQNREIRAQCRLQVPARQTTLSTRFVRLE
jgi:hypothetical protein